MKVFLGPIYKGKGTKNTHNDNEDQHYLIRFLIFIPGNCMDELLNIHQDTYIQHISN